MDFVQKDNTNMTNLQRIHEEGGAEDTLDKVKNPGDAKSTITGKEGTMSGHDAVQNDFVRYLDFINGKGDYGTAGRDHSFALASLAVVNPAAAGMIVGVIALGAAIHGIATSTFVRKAQAARRLNYIYNEVKGEGYDPTRAYVNLGFMGSSRGGFSLGKKDLENSYGPKPFRKYYDKIIKNLTDDIDKSKLLDKNGNYDKRKRDDNQENGYATANNFIATSFRMVYIPDTIVAQQQKVYRDLQQKTNAYSRWATTKDFSNLEDVQKNAPNKVNTAPIYGYVKSQLESIKELGDSVCEGFDRKMARAIKNGKYRQSQASKELKAMWAKRMQDIEKLYNEEQNKLTSSKEFIELRRRIEALSKVTTESEIVSALSKSLNVGSVFGRHVGNTFQLWVVSSNSQAHDRKALIYLANMAYKSGITPIARVAKKSELYDRSRFAHWIESGKKPDDVRIGGIYKMAFPAVLAQGSNIQMSSAIDMPLYIYVNDIDKRKNVNLNGRNYKNVRVISYTIINFSPTIGVPQNLYDVESHFKQAVKCEMIEDNTEEDTATGTQQLQSGSQSTKESTEIKFDKSIQLNEIGIEEPIAMRLQEESKTTDSSDSKSDSSDADDTTDADELVGVPDYEDAELSEFEEYMFVIPGRYTIKIDDSGKEEAITVRKLTFGNVEYYVGDKKMTSSFSDWTKKKPYQLPTVADNSEYSVLPGPPRDVQNIPGPHKYTLPKFPLTYGNFYKNYLKCIPDYEPVLTDREHKKKLSKYGLYVKDSNIGGIYLRTEGADSDFVMTVPYNFSSYIKSLGDTVLFDTEETYKEHVTEESVHESISVGFSKWLMLNESVVNESSYDGKPLKEVKKTILHSIQTKWISEFTQKYDRDKQVEIVKDDSHKRYEALKEIDKIALDKVLDDYKSTVLTKDVKEIIGDTKYDSFVERLDHIKKNGLEYMNVDREPNVNYDTIDTEKLIGSTYGRILKNVENIPNFDKIAQDLAEFNKEVRSVYTKLTKEDREKSKNSAKAQVDNKDNKQQTSTDNSANVQVNGDNNNVNNGDGNVNNSGNVTIVQNINVGSVPSLVPLFGVKSDGLYEDRDLDGVLETDGRDTDTPIEKPEMVDSDDADLKNIIVVTCADIIKNLARRTEEEEKGEGKVIIDSIKKKKPEYYTFSKKSKDEIIRTGDESKISLNSDESKKPKWTDADKKKYIVPEDFILAKAIEYNSSDDTFKFLTEEGEYTIKGEDTVIKLGFKYAQQNNEDVVGGIMSELGLPIDGTVLDIPEDILSELTKTNSSDQVNDSVWQQYLEAIRLYEDGDENNVNYVRVIVHSTDLNKREVVFKDGNGKEYTVSLKKFEEYGIDKFRSSYKKVSFKKSDLIPGSKYSVDKEYYNSILVEHEVVEFDSDKAIPLEKSDDEQIVRIVYVNDDSQLISFKVVTSQNKDEQRYLSYLYVDPSKFTKTDKDDEDDNNIEFNKGDVYVITNFDEVHGFTLAHKNESLQDYAYYKLYGMYLNEADDTKQHIMKIVKVDGDNITFSLDDKDKETYTLSKSDILSKFKLEKYEGDGDTSASFDPKGYKEQDTQVSYPLDSIKNLASIIADAKTDEEKKKQLLQFIDSNKQTIMNSGVSSSDNNEILVDLEALAQKFSAETKPEEGKIYNMLYVSASSSVTNSPVQSVIVTCDKITEGNVYFSVKDKDNKFFIPSDKMSAVYLYPMEEKKNESALYESIGVSINKNKYALYRLYGGSLLEAVDINPANPAMLAALVNMLVSANKGLSGQQTQQQSDNQDNTEQNDQQNNQQNAQNAQNQQTQQPQQPQQNNQENTNQKQMSTNVQGVPFTVQTGKPVQMV